MSAFRAVRIRDHAKHGFLLEGRDGRTSFESRMQLHWKKTTKNATFGTLLAGNREVETGRMAPLLRLFRRGAQKFLTLYITK
jgi:hypothetical protein